MKKEYEELQRNLPAGTAILICFACLLFLQPLKGQEYYRMNADFTVKIRRSDSTMNLTRGTVYYDKNIRELIYRISFPSRRSGSSRTPPFSNTGQTPCMTGFPFPR